MKILIISNKVPFPPLDGGSVATAGMIRGLVAAGHRIDLVSFNTSKHPFRGDPGTLAREEGIGVHLVDLDTGITLGGLVRNLISSPLPYTLERFRSLEMEEKLRQVLSGSDYDLVQLEGLAMALYLPALRKFFRGRICLRAHNQEYLIWERQATRLRNPLKRLYTMILAGRTQKFETRILREVDLLVPISHTDAEGFTRMGYRKPMQVIPAGVPIPEKQAAPSRKPVIAYIGALDWLPNQEGLRWFVQEVWPELRNAFPELEWRVAGRNAPPRISRLLDQPGISYLGEVPDSASFLSPAWVLVVPLFSGSGIRIKILEGMSLGIPVVTTPTGAEGLPVTGGKEIILADTAERFAGAVAGLLRDSDQRKKMGTEALHFLQENFDNVKRSAELADFYRKNLS